MTAERVGRFFDRNTLARLAFYLEAPFGVLSADGAFPCDASDPPPNGSVVRTVDGAVVEVLAKPSGRWAGDADWRESDHAMARSRVSALRLRQRAKRAVARFFDEAGFLEVDTPAAVPSPGLDLHLDAFGVADAQRWLITSPEYQMKRLLTGIDQPIWQLARCFRKDEHGPQHEPEFLMIEWYRRNAAMDAVMVDTEALVYGVATAVLPEGEAEAFAGPWPRRTVGELFKTHTGAPPPDDEEPFFRLWVEQIEPAFEPEPFFVIGWPASMASLARVEDGVALRFEAYVRGVELCNGFDELVDAAEQRARLERDHAERARRGRPTYPIDERFLGALEEGLPPSAGNALGFERLLMVLTGESIDRCVALPSPRL
ncbi:MAG: amino acid--tRNA ligase-related protein [Myxococcota bacterium]